MMPTTRAAILAVGLACAAMTAPSNTLATAASTPRAVADAASPPLQLGRAPERPAPSTTREADGGALPVKLALSVASIGALGVYLRRRSQRPARLAQVAGIDLVATAITGTPGRGDDDRGAPR